MIHWHIAIDRRITMSAYPHRQVLLDTSRRFYPILFIKQLVDAMSYAKLNVGYPSGGYPAGTPDGRYYTQEEVRELVVYSRMRGVRIIPEIEMPQHSRCLLPLVKSRGLQVR